MFEKAEKTFNLRLSLLYNNSDLQLVIELISSYISLITVQI